MVIFDPAGYLVLEGKKRPCRTCRKVVECKTEIEVWGDGLQTRSFMYVDECVEAILMLMRQDIFIGP